MRTPPKIVAVLGLLQLLFITFGYLVTASFIHLYEYGMTEGQRARWTPTIPAFIHSFGLWFFLVPISWTLIAILKGDADGGIPTVQQKHLLAGIIITVAIVVLFTLSSCAAMSMGPSV